MKCPRHSLSSLRERTVAHAAPCAHDVRMTIDALAPNDPDTLLRDVFGLRAFRPGQREVIDALLAGGARARGLPDRRRQVALLPAAGAAARRADAGGLAADRADEGPDRLPARPRDRGRAARLVARRRTRRRDGRRDGCATATLKLLYVAPERFNNERFLETLARDADLAVRRRRGALHLRVGPQLPARLPEARRDGAQRCGAERVLALTATATPAVVDDICAAFDIPARVRDRHRLLPPEPRRC